MQKPLTFDRQGLANVQFNQIVQQAPTTSQVILELSKYISSRSLTDALDLLEKRGITGDVSIFIISNLHTLSGGEA